MGIFDFIRRRDIHLHVDGEIKVVVDKDGSHMNILSSAKNREKPESISIDFEPQLGAIQLPEAEFGEDTDG